MEMTLPRALATAGDPDDSHAPCLAGMKMKDGTVYRSITEGGTEGYLAETGDAYDQTWTLNRIVTPSEVDSLLFIDSASDSGEMLEIRLGK